MSTLTIPAQRSTESDGDTRFEVLVHSAGPVQRQGHAVDFETVFDLDYGQPVPEQPAQAQPAQAQPAQAQSTQAQPAAAARRVRRIRAVKTQMAAPQRVRLTSRGRTVLVLTFLALALALMIPMSGWATATLTGGSPEPVQIVEVKPGDTLYGIAGDLAETGEVREMVHRIQQLNSLPGGQITEGQKLAVPRG